VYKYLIAIISRLISGHPDLRINSVMVMMTFKELLFSPFSREKRNEYNGILWGFYFLTWDIEDTKSVEFASVAICSIFFHKITGL